MNAIPDSVRHVCLIGVRAALHHELKVVADVNEFGGAEVLHCRGFVVVPPQVHVHRCPGPVPQSEVECYSSLQNPAIWCNRNEAGEKTVERHELSQAGQAHAGGLTAREKATLKGLAEGARRLILHGRPPT